MHRVYHGLHRAKCINVHKDFHNLMIYDRKPWFELKYVSKYCAMTCFYHKTLAKKLANSMTVAFYQIYFQYQKS